MIYAVCRNITTVLLREHKRKISPASEYKYVINQFLQEYHGITSILFLKLKIPYNSWDVFISGGLLKNDTDTCI
jgi:hypothetical protein